MHYGHFIVSIVALLISIFSLIVSWYVTLRPASIIGDLSYLVIWRLSSNNDGLVTDVTLTPALWLQNTGARPTIIKDLRLVFKPKGQEIISATPYHPFRSQPLKILVSSTNTVA